MSAPDLGPSEDFAPHMEAVARHFWGEPNRALSTKETTRWGSQGSKAVELEEGVWFDHESGAGGGVLSLVERETGLKGREGADYMRDKIGLPLPMLPERSKPTIVKRIAATYDYTDINGDLVFQVVRFEPKDFRQRRPDQTQPDGWLWSARGIDPLPYRLPEIVEAISQDQTVFIVEGEKDADNLWKLGIPATCNSGGAGKWPAEISHWFDRADVAILRDNDDAGRSHGDLVGSALKSVAKRVRYADLPGLETKGDVSDYLAKGFGPEALYAFVEAEAKVWQSEPPKSRFGAVAWASIDSANVQYPYLVKGLFFQSDKGMMFGESRSGKSFLAVDMGLAIARGIDWLGHKTAKGGVLYQAGEGGRGLIKRLAAYKQEHRVWEDLPFVLLPEKVDLFSQEGDGDAFVAECLAWKGWLSEPLRLVVIDTFSTASPGANENDSADMGRMLAAGDKINKATGAAILWVHHKNASGLRERGHTSFRANVDTAIEVIRDEESKERHLRLVKLKDGEDGLELGFALQSVTIGTDDDGDPITSCVVRSAQVGSTRTGQRTRLTTGQNAFLKVLDDAIRVRGGVVPPCDECPPGTYGVEWNDFRDLFVRVCGGGRKDGAVRTQLSRDGNTLWLQKLIARHDPWLWITPDGERFL